MNQIIKHDYQGYMIDSVTLNELSSLNIIRSDNKTVINASVDGKDVSLAVDPDAKSTLNGLPTVVSVCKSVILKLLSLDETDFGKNMINHNHWSKFRGYRVEMGKAFPAHAIINVRDRETAEDVGEYLNNMFKKDRARFPAQSGWKAVVTTGASKPSLSDFDHPFYYYKNTGNMNSRAARIMVVVDLATEGLNNRFVSVWGCATKTISDIDALQRLGRPVRTAAKHDHFNKVVTVPPASHDNLYVICHEDYPAAVESIKRAFWFIQNSTSIITNATTIYEYANSSGADVGEDNYDPSMVLGVWERFRIAQKIGDAMNNGKRPSLGKIVASVLGKKIKEHKRRFGMGWAESAYAGTPVNCYIGTKKDGVEVWGNADALADLKSWIRKTPPAPLENVLGGEEIIFNSMDYQECLVWLESQTGWGPAYASSMTSSEDKDAAVVSTNKLRRVLGGSVLDVRMDTRETPRSVIDKISADLNDKLGHDVGGIVVECAINRFSSIRKNLVIDDFEMDAPLCRPEITHEMRDSDFQSAIRDYVVYKLLQSGKLNDIAQILKV